jgi:hypothetical protein
MGVVLGLKPLQPDLVAGAIVAGAGRNRHRDLPGTCLGRNYQRLSLGRSCAVCTKHCGHGELAA